MFRWRTLGNFFGAQAFFGIVAVVIVVSNAPIFQNVGTEKGSLERTLLVSHYIMLTISLFLLFLGTLLFRAHCPDVVAEHPYLNGFLEKRAPKPAPGTDDPGYQARYADALAEWEAWNESQPGRALTSAVLVVFIACFLLALCLEIASLLVFASSSGRVQQVAGSSPPRSAPVVISGAIPAKAQHPLESDRTASSPPCRTGSLVRESRTARHGNTEATNASPTVPKTSQSEKSQAMPH